MKATSRLKVARAKIAFFVALFLVLQHEAVAQDDGTISGGGYLDPSNHAVEYYLCGRLTSMTALCLHAMACRHSFWRCVRGVWVQRVKHSRTSTGWLCDAEVTKVGEVSLLTNTADETYSSEEGGDSLVDYGEELGNKEPGAVLVSNSCPR
jgi:hypothetical protein